jgi:hypothetical protein
MSVIDNILSDTKTYTIKVGITAKYKCKECEKIIESPNWLTPTYCKKNETDDEVIKRLTGAFIWCRNHVSVYACQSKIFFPITTHKCTKSRVGICELTSIDIITVNDIPVNFAESDHSIANIAIMKKKK